MSAPSRPGLSLASKTSVNRKKGAIRIQRVGLKDPFPTNFLTFLHALPSDNIPHDVTESTEPPKKRIRTEHTDRAESIPIARETLTVKRPAQPDAIDADLISRANVQCEVKIQYAASHVLGLTSNYRTPYNAFKTEIDLSHTKLTKSVSTILNVLNRAQDESHNEKGSLWVSVAIELGRKNNKDQLQFSFELYWNSSTNSFPYASRRSLSQQVLDTFFSRGRDTAEEKLSPQAFYDAAFIPQKDHTNYLSLTAPRLTSKLFPFQRRALQWLLTREGVKWSDRCSNGKPGLESLSPLPSADLPLSFSTAKDANGRSIYISDLYHIVTRDITPFQVNESALKGGILAEEMGLGKTVETISLICMHTRGDLPSPNNHIDGVIRPSGATLIITPATLKNQWVSEFMKHAPHLRVKVYAGLKGFNGKEDELISELVEHDVVITTYSVLQTEIHYAEEPPSRSMRYQRKYQRPKSPLIQISWWRVCIDEAQQIESGVSSAAKVARLIPRVNAWGITGTPVKENVKDLWGLLFFLRYEPFASSIPIWEGLITTHKDLFKTVFSRIALRHTKRAVRDELTLPPQKRYVITMPFTAVEEHHYQQHFKALATKCGLDTNGAPLADDWDPDDPSTIDWMKRSLALLRQSILHPSLGPRNESRAIDQKTKALRTVEEVLDAMIETSEASLRADQRTYLLGQLEIGQILENQSQMDEAMKTWEQVVEDVKFLEEECRKQLQSDLEKAKRMGQDETRNTETPNDEDSDEEGVSGRINESRRKLRSMLDIHHRAVFFIASGYYQVKTDAKKTKPGSKEFDLLEEKEVAGYDVAKDIRKEILHEARSKALAHIAGVRGKAVSQSFVEVPEIKFPSFHGLESRRVLDNFQVLGLALNTQADLVDQWRETVIQMLIRPLVDEDDEVEITGDEYEDSTKLQDELMVYTLALRALIADRQDAISGLENERVKYDTRFAERQAKEQRGHAPEKVLELLKRRQQVKPTSQGTSFRGIVTDLRELATKLRYEVGAGSSRARIELDIVEKQLRSTQEQTVAQNKAATALERELDTFIAAMNARVEYYRQLQGVSDTVAPLDLGKVGLLDIALGRIRYDAECLKKKIATALPKHRYLLHLKESDQTAEEECVICQGPFTLGVLTVCGHQFCKECILFWFKTSRSCPVCKKALTTSMLHDITLKKQELRLHQENLQEHLQWQDENNLPTKMKGLGIYSKFGNEKLEAIKSIDLNGPSFTTKIETLAKHLIWLREEDPGAKSVIFSQFGGFLEVLSHAFDMYNIGHTSFSTKNGINRFKEDPAIECFLMDARAHASGLNLVNASHVFLCEPLLNTALELQAIARVDRIGQEHETTVWLYLIDGTVEESIYELSVQRRLEHLGKNSKDKDKDKGKSKESTPEVSDLNLEVANSMELQQAALSKLMNGDRSLGEVIDKNDLWQCLFGHVAKQQRAAAQKLNDAAVIGFLTGEAAEARRRNQG